MSSLPSRFIRLPLLGAITLYQWVISPLVHLLVGPGQGCRFEPSCSHYAKEAIRIHGPVHGGGLAARRISRCNPFGASGYDPVPMVSPDVSKQPDLKGK